MCQDGLINKVSVRQDSGGGVGEFNKSSSSNMAQPQAKVFLLQTTAFDAPCISEHEVNNDRQTM